MGPRRFAPAHAEIEVRHAGPADLLPASRVRAETTALLRRVYWPVPDAQASRQERAVGNEADTSTAAGRSGGSSPSPSARPPNLAGGPGRVLVALRAGAIVGTLEYLRDDAHRIHVRNLGVRELDQRRGVARALLDAVAAHARAASIEVLSLETIAETGNVPIFERLGFEVVKSAPAAGFRSQHFDTLTRIYMERRSQA